MTPESFEMERGPGGWRRKEPERTPEPPPTITMWSSASPTGLIHVTTCPACKALVLLPDYPAHERWHRDA